MSYEDFINKLNVVISGISYGNLGIEFFVPILTTREEANYKLAFTQQGNTNTPCIYQLQNSISLTSNNSNQYFAEGNKHEYTMTFLFCKYVQFNDGVYDEESHIKRISELEKSVLKFKDIFYKDRVEGIKLTSSSPFTEIKNIFSENFDAIMLNLTFEVDKFNFC